MASIGFKFYVSNFASYDAVYGSLGAVIVLLMWLFVTGFVILLGGEINDVVRKDRVRRSEQGAAERDLGAPRAV